jgi:hypothetical protein
VRLDSLALSCLLTVAVFRTAATPVAVDPPADLSLNSRISAIATASKAAIAGVWLEASDSPAQLVILDIGDAKHPRTLGRIATEGIGAVALSGNGTLALLDISLEATQYNKATKHAVVAVDLTNPSAPRQLWRREITAYSVGLADSAGSYYVITPTPSENTDEKRSLSIVRVSDGKVVKVAVPRYNSDQYRVSANGRFVLSPDHGNIAIRDLDTPASLIAQEYYGTQRYACSVDVLSNGDAVMGDSRTPRLGIYANRQFMPRLSTLEIPTPDDSQGCPSKIGGDDPTLYIYDGRSIGRIDLSDHQNPRQMDQWLVPGYGPPLAVGGNTLLASIGPVGHTLRVVSLQPGSSVSPVPFDWNALDASYESAVKQYEADKRAGKAFPSLKAQESLDEALVQVAVDMTVTGIQPEKAAAILNDYGFFLVTGFGSSVKAERFFRRAIEIDPARKVAYLNLGDLLRKELPLESNWEKKAARKHQADQAYRKYMSLGGKATPAIAEFIEDDWATARPATFCSAVAKMANRGRLSELVSNSGFNLNVGASKVDVVYTTEGTAHVPGTYVSSSSTDLQSSAELPLPVDSEGLWGGDNLGLLVYAGLYHTLHYRDLTHPTASISTDGKTACAFTVKTVEVLDKATPDPPFCLQVLHGSRQAALPFTGTSWMTRGDIAARYSETAMDGVASMDIRGDGHPIMIGKLALSSGAGAGCGETFFDLLDRNASRFEDGATRDLLMQMQKASPTSRYPVQCGNDPRFFESNGKIYFESRPTNWPPSDTSDQYHYITQIENGQAIEACHFRFTTEVAGTAVDPLALRPAPPK